MTNCRTCGRDIEEDEHARSEPGGWDNLCVFCDLANHTNGQCPYSWTGTHLVIARFGDVEAAARLIKHRDFRISAAKERGDIKMLDAYDAQSTYLWGDPDVKAAINTHDPNTHDLISVVAEADDDEPVVQVCERIGGLTDRALMFGLSERHRESRPGV